MKLCQRIFWCLTLFNVLANFQKYWLYEQSSEPQKVPNLCFDQNLIETYNMSVVIYVFQLLA